MKKSGSNGFSKALFIFSLFITTLLATAADACFAECNYTRQRRLCTRQRTVGISLHGKGFFAECRMSGTRQRIFRVPRRHLAKKSRCDGQVMVMAPLPSATRRHSAKKCVFYFFKKMLCRVPESDTR